MCVRGIFNVWGGGGVVTKSVLCKHLQVSGKSVE